MIDQIDQFNIMIEMNQEEKEIGRLHQKENTNMVKNQINIMIIDIINLEIMKKSINLEI